MNTPAILSSRIGDTIAAILPKITTTVSNRASPKIDLATAENWLIRSELCHIYKEAIQKGLNNEALSYSQGFGGDPKLLEAAAGFFNTYFNPCMPVLPSHIVATPGATACLDSVLFSICDEGDSVLVPAPYWSGFDFHFTLRARVKIIPVLHQLPPNTSNTTQNGITDALNHSLLLALEDAYRSAPDPSRIKALVITNPQNPLAQCYPKWILLEIMQFCADHDLQYVSDELYGMSDLSRLGEGNEGSATPFISALSLDALKAERNADTLSGNAVDKSVAETHANSDGEPNAEDCLSKPAGSKRPRIHVIWSLSKDFGSSGLRMGFLISQSSDSRFLLASTFVLSTIHLSSLTSIAATHLLSSPQLPKLLSISASRLKANQSLIIGRFCIWGIPFHRPDAGPYITARLVSNAQTKEEQEAAFQKISDAGVLVAPAHGFGGWVDCCEESQKYGWARITIAVPLGQLMMALDKIGNALGLQQEGLPLSDSEQPWKRRKADGQVHST